MEFDYLEAFERMNDLAPDVADDAGNITTEVLVEEYAKETGHPEWLTDKSHLVWEAAQEIVDWCAGNINP